MTDYRDIELDIDRFWIDDELAHEENCFSDKSPQMALGIRMSDECVYAELGVEGDQWGVEPIQRRLDFNKRYNDLSEKIVGKRLLSEAVPNTDAEFPKIKRIGEVFGGRYEYTTAGGEWLHEAAENTKELEAILDNVDGMDMREFLLPDNWESEKKRIYEEYGIMPTDSTVAWVRGPITLATSIFGVENLIFLYYDAPELYKRFSDTIADVIIRISDVMYSEAGYTEQNAPHGFGFADDNCYILTPDMYRAFGYPVLKRVFDHFSPNPDDRRYQHSDSAMDHLLPILNGVNLTGCNFGPTVTVDKIRTHMKTTRIDGCMAPFTFMNNDKKLMEQELLRDYIMAVESGVKGINLSTAGSINDGSSLESMRFIMKVIQDKCRY